jgi:hypothetical protein
MKALTILFFLMVSASAFSQEKACLDDIRTGRFQHTSELGTSIIWRREKEQLEKFGSSMIICKVKWISDSEYVLRVKKTANCPPVLKKGDKIHVKITDCTQTTYRCNITFSNGHIENIEYTIIREDDKKLM